MRMKPTDYPVLGQAGKLSAPVQVNDLKKDISEKSEKIDTLCKEKTKLESKIE